MTKDALIRKIILLETTGFLMLTAIQWLNELLDFPHLLLGAAPTPVNIQECLIENLATLGLALLVLMLTRRLVRKIRHLEGFLPVCSFCKRIRVDGEWVSLDYYIHHHSDAQITHTLCAECAAREYGEKVAVKD